jgi:hypothetical protein
MKRINYKKFKSLKSDKKKYKKIFFYCDKKKHKFKFKNIFKNKKIFFYRNSLVKYLYIKYYKKKEKFRLSKTFIGFINEKDTKKFKYKCILYFYKKKSDKDKILKILSIDKNNLNNKCYINKFKNSNLKQEIIESTDKKIITCNVKFCVFVGREKNMKILHSYIQQGLMLNIINEYHMFDFSRNIIDQKFIIEEYKRLMILYPNKIFLHNNENNKILEKKLTKTDWSPFYKFISTTSNNDDVIIKCDDDILFIDIYSLKNAINDRINDKKSFIIHSNCINNGVCTYYQSSLYDKIKGQINEYPKGGLLGILFNKPEIAYAIHNQFTADILSDINNLNKYVINDVYINSRISINFFILNGEDAKYLKDVGCDDEYEVSSLIPEKLLRPNKIKGDLLTAHLSYSFQEKFILNKDVILNNYKKILEKYKLLFENNDNSKNIINNYNNIISNNLLMKSKNFNNNTYIVKNWINNNCYYIKNYETNKYLYIDYENDELTLSEKKTFFEIFNLKDNPMKIEIKLGIYYLTKYNCKGKFRNESIFFKYVKDESEREILKEDFDIKNNSFYIKFLKYNAYLTINDKNIDIVDSTLKKSNKWVLEKVENSGKEYIKVNRFLKNKKFYYKNIETGEVFTNYYLGWGYENIISN